MLNELEHEYQNGLSERRFWNYYGLRATIIIVIAAIFTIVFGFSPWIVAGVASFILVVFVGYFFHVDMKRVMGDKQPRRYFDRLRAYADADKEIRIDNLLQGLQKYNLCQKDNLRLAIEYFEHRQPISAKTGLLEWTLSIVVTLSSLVAIAYDDNLRTIDVPKLLGILLPSFQIAASILIPVLLVGFISNRIFFSKDKIDTLLLEDLIFIYANYSQYQAKLEQS